MKRLGIAFVLVVLLVTMVGAAPVAAAPSMQPGQGSAAQPAADTVYYVRPGDTLAKIAARFGVTVTAILRANPTIKNPNRIYVGQRLVIPGGGGGTATFTRVKVALIAENSGSLGCGDGVVMVNRDVPKTTAPLTAAIGQLLSIKSQYYGESGLYNALYQSNLSIQSVTLVRGVATIKLTGSLLSGGTCDDPRIIAQFDRTARQFSTVSQVKVYVNGRLLSELLSGN